MLTVDKHDYHDNENAPGYELRKAFRETFELKEASKRDYQKRRSGQQVIPMAKPLSPAQKLKH